MKKGDIHKAIKDFDLAVYYYDQVLKLDRLDECLNLKAVCLNFLNKQTETIQCLNELIHLNSNIPSYYYSKAKVLFEQKSYDLALNEIDRALNNFSLNAPNWIFQLPLAKYNNLKKDILKFLGNFFFTISYLKNLK